MATASQSNTITLPTVTTGGQDATHYALFSASSGGTRLTDWITIGNNPSALTSGQRYAIAAGQAVLTWSNSAADDFTEAGRRFILNAALVDVQAYLGLSENGTSEMSGDGYARQAIDFTIA